MVSSGSSGPFPVEGGCDCGHVRYRLETAPFMCHACHCSWCQRETGSAFVLNATIESKHYTDLRSPPILTSVPSASGQGQTIARCPKCYVAVWSVFDGGAEMPSRSIKVGTLDDPNVCPPQCHIYTATKQKWLRLDDGLKQFVGIYDFEKEWSRENFERFRKVKEEMERLSKGGRKWETRQGEV